MKLMRLVDWKINKGPKNLNETLVKAKKYERKFHPISCGLGQPTK